MFTHACIYSYIYALANYHAYCARMHARMHVHAHKYGHALKTYKMVAAPTTSRLCEYNACKRANTHACSCRYTCAQAHRHADKCIHRKPSVMRGAWHMDTYAKVCLDIRVGLDIKGASSCEHQPIEL